jgi:hypothetical protein
MRGIIWRRRRRRRANYIGHILNRNCLLEHAIEEKVKEKTRKKT